jgi:hypothetical protein
MPEQNTPRAKPPVGSDDSPFGHDIPPGWSAKPAFMYLHYLREDTDQSLPVSGLGSGIGHQPKRHQPRHKRRSERCRISGPKRHQWRGMAGIKLYGICPRRYP